MSDKRCWVSVDLPMDTWSEVRAILLRAKEEPDRMTALMTPERRAAAGWAMACIDGAMNDAPGIDAWIASGAPAGQPRPAATDGNDAE